MTKEAKIGNDAAASQGMPRVAGRQEPGAKQGTASPGDFRRAWPCRHFDFGSLASRTMGE